MSQEWFYTVDGEQQGPVSAAELKQLATAGKLSESDLVWKEGMGNWVPAKSIKGLFGAAPSSASNSGTKKPEPIPAPKSSPGVSKASSAFDRGDEEDDRPRARKRPIDEDEEDDRPRSRGRAQATEDDDDYRPSGRKKLRDDEDDDDIPRPKKKKKPKDDGKKKLNIVGLIGLVVSVLGLGMSFVLCVGICFGIPTISVGFILSVVGLVMSLTTKKYEFITSIVGIVLCLIAAAVLTIGTMKAKNDIDKGFKKLDENLKEMDKKAKEERAKSEQNAPKMSAAALAQEFAQNRDAAEDKYDGKVIEITGQIRSVKREFGITTVILNTGNPVYPTIECTLTDEPNNGRNKAVNGATVTIIGESSGYDEKALTMEECRIK